MMLKINTICFVCLSLFMAGENFAGARILSLKGDVKVRRGMEETWQPAAVNMLLEDMDSILNGETGSVVLSIDDGRTFYMGGNSILDIADLRRITEQQLFLYLTARKIRSLDPPAGEKPIRIQNVSTVRADDRSQTESASTAANDLCAQETNAALAMAEQAFYPNAVMKMHKILEAHGSIADKGSLYFYLGRSFEALDDRGRALEAYQSVLRYATPKQRSFRSEAESAMKRLKQ